MGVVYKITEEVKRYIIATKKKNPNLSVRKIALISSKKFNRSISKSTVNNIIKGAKLSAPVGRHRIRREAISSLSPKAGVKPALIAGIYLAKAIEKSRLEGVNCIVNLLQEGMIDASSEKIRTLIETLLYLPFLGTITDYKSKGYIKESLERLTGTQVDYEELLSYLEQLQYNTAINYRLYREFLPRIREVQYFKLVLSDDSTIFIDGSLRTIWPYSNIPADFYTTYYFLNSYVNKTFVEKTEPFVIFVAPLVDRMPEGLFDFIACCNFPSQIYIKNITFFTSDMEEISSIYQIPRLKTEFIIALSPGQYTADIVFEDKGEEGFFRFGPYGDEIILGEGRAEFTQLKLNQIVTLRTISLKKPAQDRAFLILLTNIDRQVASKEAVAEIYLNKWPDFRDALDDFQKKVEFFSFGLKRIFTTEETKKQAERGYIPEALSFEDILKQWRYSVLKYCITHLLSIGYDRMSPEDITKKIFNLKGEIVHHPKYTIVRFLPERDVQLARDIAYIAKRACELASSVEPARLLWFES